MRRLRRALCLLALAGSTPTAWAQAEVAGAIAPTPDAPQSTDDSTAASPNGLLAPVLPPDMLDGALIYRQFRDGLADPDCQPQSTDAKWQRHFSHAPERLADREDDILPLFGYVVGVMRDADLPTEFALIPFVESGYHPGVSSSAGPAGLWQFVSLTARNHGVRMRRGYDGRLSPVDSTQAAVRYLKTLHGMFGGDWRLAVMAYNAGENRVLQAMQRAGVSAGNAHPTQLRGLSKTTTAYVEKLHALACSLEQAGDQPSWLTALQRPVPRLQPLELPSDFGSLSAWAQREGHDADQLAGLNPALSRMRSAPAGGSLWVLAPAPNGASPRISASDLIGGQDDGPNNGDADAPFLTRRAADDTDASHKVVRGDTLSTIARRYGVRTQQLLKWNKLKARAIIKPGMVLIVSDPSR
ncbi:membrane-bound lytic murein transglycosylase D [Pseudoxanthomonas sp. GM95]|uniref:lytic transglycosylase domain-containing protein n=1 Tax=Pseudoxanthomonas sp. GM95 TaxID=1881043 RepID=UPI0008BB1FC7|nr:lytic transglycosylase domain-containing protein [Pseudoxanthomonas sp. GM95]SEK73003.1 membrane-bound lytic murein transglycosylase D [Pseudoxanthomonas sp. GM95]